MPSNWTDPETGRTFPTGASPTSRAKLLRAQGFTPPLKALPAQVAYVPKARSNFGNDRYGICVTAEEAFAKTCVNPELEDAIEQLNTVCIAWARSHGVLNGASLDEVLDWMYQKGFQIGAQLYNDGSKLGVDFENEPLLKAAIAEGPVKIAIAAGALPSGAGSRDGWYSLTANNHRTDHSTSLCGYGPADWLYEQLRVPLPSGLPATTPGYLHYTWSTIGFVSHAWIKGTCDEAWIRHPTTIGVPPLVPTPGPGPDPSPSPGPSPYATGELFMDNKASGKRDRFLVIPAL